MRKINCILIEIALCLCLCARAYAFSAEDIISPVPGNWNNVQALVLNNPQKEELYFSLSGTDPLLLGFAYDEPVIIDEIGDVTVRITAIDQNGVRSDYSVLYRVTQPSFETDNPDTSLFIQNISQNPIRKCTSGTSFFIPEDFTYTMDNSAEPVIKGTAVSVSPRNRLERYVPCTVSDGRNRWHFVIHTVASQVLYSSAKKALREVPFEIQDWNTFVPLDFGYIFQFDDEYWQLYKSPLLLDRTRAHTVRWQSLSYKEGNPVFECTIPPRASLVSHTQEDGSVRLSADTASYKQIPYMLGSAKKAFSAGSIGGALNETLVLDTFYGDCALGTVKVGIYYDGIYQGEDEIDFVCDRQPPHAPVIETSEKNRFARNKVHLTISSAAENSVFYAVSNPLRLGSGFVASDTSLFDAIPVGAFAKYTPSTEIELSSVNGEACFYKVSAYAVDNAGNISPMSEYRVIVDEYNYYIGQAEGEPLGSSTQANGSYARPFTTLSQAAEAIRDIPFARIHILSDLSIGKDELCTLSSDCVFIGDNSRISFDADAIVGISGCTVTFKNCILQKYGTGSGSVSPVFRVSKGSLVLEDCEVVSAVHNKGALIDMEESELSLKKTGMTLQSDTYAYAVTGTSSSVSVENSRITVAAPECIALSINGGSLKAVNSAFHIIGNLGRSIELSNSTASLEFNTFNATATASSASLSAVWQDSRSTLLLDTGNTIGEN